MSRRTQAQLEEEQRREATCEAFGHQDVVRAPRRQLGVVEELARTTSDYCRYCQDWVTS